MRDRKISQQLKDCDTKDREKIIFRNFPPLIFIFPGKNCSFPAERERKVFTKATRSYVEEDEEDDDRTRERSEIKG